MRGRAVVNAAADPDTLGGLGEWYRAHATVALAQLWQGGDPAIRQAIVEAMLTMGPATLD